MVCEFEIRDNLMKVSCANCVFGSSIEDFDVCFAKTVDKVLQNRKVERIILSGIREYEYDYDQTKLIIEIAELYDKLVNREKILSFARLGSEKCERCFPKRLAELQFLLTEMIRKDPIGAYIKINRMIRANTEKAKEQNLMCKKCYDFYINNALVKIRDELEKTSLIQMVKDKIYGYRLGDRSIYREIFNPLIRPVFMLTRYMPVPPKGGRPLKRYKISGNIIVEIFDVPGKVRKFYHVSPPEFRLSDEKYSVIDSARRYLGEHRPTETETTQPERAREMLTNMSKEYLIRLSLDMGLQLTENELNEMVDILVRYTTGFGVLEVLLADDKVQDIYINSPIGITPIYLAHDDFEECETNLIPTREDAEGWATRFRLLSGRPLDEANPVLDTELFAPGGRARVCAITRTLSPEGIGYSIRRHRERPWTYPLFIDVKFCDPIFAGLMSFFVDGSRALLFSGGRSSGKTSLLSATLLEIMKKFRIVTLEDSVTGDTQIVFERNGNMERNYVGRLIDELIERYDCENYVKREVLSKNPENIRVFSINSDGKIILSPVSSFIRHKVNKDIFEITTRTGRKIKVTGDHSLFTLGVDGTIEPIRCRDLKENDFLVTPRILPVNNIYKKSINILDHLEKVKDGYVIGDSVRNFVEENRNAVIKVVDRLKYSKITVGWWKKNNLLPCKILFELMKEGYKINDERLFFKASKNSKSIPMRIFLDDNFLTLVGLWLADGCYDRRSVIISVVDEDSRDVVRNLGKKLNINVSMHSDEFSLILNSVTLKKVMKNILELNGDAFTKKIPGWMFNLSKEQVGHVLKGIFSGDGYLAKYEVGISLSSKDMIKDIQTLLLWFGVIGRLHKVKRDSTHSLRISSIESLRFFSNNIGFVQKMRNEDLKKMCGREPTHDVSDIIPLKIELKETMANICEDFNVYDYIDRNNNIGRKKFQNYIKNVPFDGSSTIKNLEILANSEIFWDQIKSIRHIENKEDYVYDFSVPRHENFICENILAHNTLELPVFQLRNLGYNIERLKSRSVITRVESELPADEALRTAIRLGDSCLIVGEVRSTEAKALYEAMRIGALTNVVAGTIHGESAYGVFDRVVNDLGVQPTSFKATDIIIICGRLRTSDGLHTFRRVLEVTEVRKKWQNDPVEEGGFVNLMEYDAKEDKLKPTETLLNGESFIVNEIAKRVKEWHGNWDAVWSNIELRGKVKQAMVDYARKIGNKEILEAETVATSNEMFHVFSNDVREDLGYLDSKEIFDKWDEWFKKKIKVL